ncbi:MAG: glycosyltransferase family 2 protein [Marinagarivorans sp.]|nr:glycosyltransferase family 2 protein [Marinagarivorans sp.]
MTKRVGISIVNYRTGQLVIECLQSLIAIFDTLPYSLSVVVVDNLSPDDSVAKLSEFLAQSPAKHWINLIAAPKNGGFSYGNNIAVKKLLTENCDYIWLLNPDTRVLPNACEALIDCLNANPTAAIAGSALQDPDGTQQIASFNFPTVWGELVSSSGLAVLAKKFPASIIARPIPTERCRVDWVAGASMMITTQAIKEVGLMDENYFLYFEEVDYCRTFHQAGYDTLFEPASKVIHLVGAATGISNTRKQAPRRPAYWFHSRCYFFQKNYGFFNALIADKLGGLGYIIYRLKLILKGEVYLGPPYFLYDFIRHSSFFCGNLVKAANKKRSA